MRWFCLPSLQVAVDSVNCLGSMNPLWIFWLKVLCICSTLSFDDNYNGAVIHRGFPLDVISCGCSCGDGMAAVCCKLKARVS